MLQKLYGTPPPAQMRYSPAKRIGVRSEEITGSPVRSISTSYVERQNLAMHMAMHRFIGLTNAFSKKLANHEGAAALHFMHYNVVRASTSHSGLPLRWRPA